MPFNTSAKYANGGRNSWLKKILCAVNFPNRSKHSGDQPQPRHPRVESAANSHEAYGNTQGPGAGVGGDGDTGSCRPGLGTGDPEEGAGSEGGVPQEGRLGVRASLNRRPEGPSRSPTP